MVFKLHERSTKKIQRYKCRDCGRTFTNQKKYYFSRSLKEHCIKRHVEGKSSYRDLSRDKYINQRRIWSWVNEYAQNSKTAKETSFELKPQWSGYLVADGKTIKVKRKRNCLVVGVDFNGDVPLAEYGIGPENKSQYMRFFEGLKELEYPLKGLVSDGNPDICVSARQYYSHFRYQTCLKHFLRGIDRSFGYLTVKRRRLDKEYQSELLLREQLYSLIYAKTYEIFLNQYHILKKKKFKSEHCQRMIVKLKYNLHSIIAHYFDPRLQLTNNLAENFIKQINRRLKLIEGFQNPKTAEGYLRLLVMYLRFKPYTDAKRLNKYRNGKSRLELADVDARSIDWLKFSQRKF